MLFKRKKNHRKRSREQKGEWLSQRAQRTLAGSWDAIGQRKAESSEVTGENVCLSAVPTPVIPSEKDDT